MATKTLDTRGLKCPVPVLKMSQLMMRKEVGAGDVLEVVADCPSFEADVRAWCGTWQKVLVRIEDEGGGVRRAFVQL